MISLVFAGHGVLGLYFRFWAVLFIRTHVPGAFLPRHLYSLMQCRSVLRSLSLMVWRLESPEWNFLGIFGLRFDGIFWQ